MFCYLLLIFHVSTRTRFSLRDMRLFEIIEVEITRVDCMHPYIYCVTNKSKKGLPFETKNTQNHENRRFGLIELQIVVISTISIEN